MDDQPVMISALEHYSYCPRQFALIHIEQGFEDNLHTLRGHAAHARVDVPKREWRKGVWVETALPLHGFALGLIGRADAVEFETDGTPYPVEYKHGPKRVRLHDDVQLAAQALCLEEMFGRPVPKGAIYHVTSKHRREVLIGEDLRAEVHRLLAEIRALIAAGRTPAPVNDARCRNCSLIQLCQPQGFAQRQSLSQLRAHLYEVEDP